MEKRKFHVILFAMCALSAVIGIMLGYFVFGPIGVSATMFELQELSIGKPVNYEIPATQGFAKIEFEEQEYKFTVASENGYIVVYYAGESPQIKEITFTPINALPAEEQERLARGIHIYTEEELVRILEDYGS
jgi:hypothetical protein